MATATDNIESDQPSGRIATHRADEGSMHPQPLTERILSQLPGRWGC